MNEARLSPCRTCGKEISTNLAKRSSYMRDTESVGCPHCGEAEPHLTEEEIERRIEYKKKREEEVREREIERREEEKEEKAREETVQLKLERDRKRYGIGFFDWVCLGVLICLFVIIPCILGVMFLIVIITSGGC